MNARQSIRHGIPIYIAAVVMRSSMTVMNPLLPIFKSQYHLSAFHVSFLSSLPVLCFAGAGLLMPLVRRIGVTNRIIATGLMTITFGVSARMFGNLPLLFLSVIAVGIGIAILNFTLPVWIKEEVPEHSGLLTSFYVTLMGIFAAIAIAAAVPLSRLTSIGWRLSMVPWLILGLFSSTWWLNMNRNQVELADVEMSPHFHARFFRSFDAWAITLFFGFQSMLAYGTATWLPSILLSKGFSLNQAGYAVSATGLMGSLLGIFVPYLAVKIKKLRMLLMSAGLLFSFSFGALIYGHGWYLVMWLLLGNVGLAVTFQVSLLLTIFRGASAGETRSLSIMSQSFGYLMAMFAPGFVGAIFDATGNWNDALIIPIVLGILVAIVGSVAARDGTV